MRISPIARKIAESENLDIEMIKGTGPKGRITKADVEKVLTEKASETSHLPVEIDKATKRNASSSGDEESHCRPNA